VALRHCSCFLFTAPLALARHNNVYHAFVAEPDAPAPCKDLDPAVSNHILVVPDAQRTKDALAAATDCSAATDARDHGAYPYQP
jgi:hypothetical protein